jgi:hypothetical protein
MRTFLRTVTALLVLTTLTFAGQKEVDTKIINKNLLRGMNHGNPGLVESAIRVAVLMKIKYSDADYDDIIDQLDELVLEGTNNNIRLKALIASDYLRNFKQYRWLKDKDYSEGDELFYDYLSKISFKGIAKSK